MVSFWYLFLRGRVKPWRWLHCHWYGMAFDKNRKAYRMSNARHCLSHLPWRTKMRIHAATSGVNAYICRWMYSYACICICAPADTQSHTLSCTKESWFVATIQYVFRGYSFSETSSPFLLLFIFALEECYRIIDQSETVAVNTIYTVTLCYKGKKASPQSVHLGPAHPLSCSH